MLRQNIVHDPAVDVGQPEVAAGEAVGEPLVVEPHKMQNRRVQISHVNLVFGGPQPDRVGGAVVAAAADAGAEVDTQEEVCPVTVL